MKTKIGILVLCLFCQFCFGQNNTRKSLHAQVLNDSLQVDNGYVFNINSKTRTFISSDGFFDLLAKAKDTLLISSLAFKSKRVILTEANLSVPLLLLKLELYENKLKEVVVLKKRNLNPISGGSQKYVDIEFFDDQKSSPKNTTMHAHTIENGVNFVRIFKDAIKLLNKKEPKQPTDFVQQDFAAITMKRINSSFFTNTLQLKSDEIGLFLLFCENDVKAQSLLKPENEFQLIDFLITKNEEFKRITTFEK